ADLDASLRQVVAELQLAHPSRVIHAGIDIGEEVLAETRRLSQLLSNLIANALTHGAPDTPVHVKAPIDGQIFEISVANHGGPIEELARAPLFRPRARASVKPRQGGLGLGLWLCNEIARGHGGRTMVDSEVDETRFTCHRPHLASDEA